MKNVIFLGAILIVTLGLNAQEDETINGTTFKVNGNIGIGTTNPNIWFQTDILEINKTRPLISLKSNGHLGTLVFTNTKIAEDHYGEFHLNHEFIENESGKSKLRFFSYPGGDVLTLLSNGKIGVGTTNPDMKLTVKGSIHAEEVKIDLAVPAPDYVFNKDYNLRSITELERYINKHGHLPEIPSAEDFEQNGVMLAEMNMNLLKKIEELTLYTIQQQKEIYRLKEIEERLGEIEKLLESKE